MTEPLPEKIQADLNFVRGQIQSGFIAREEIAEKVGILCLNAYNVGKDPSFDMIPIT